MLRVWVWEMLVLTWSLQFAYLQISTVICALIRRLELRIEGEFPKSDYSVRSLSLLPCGHCWGVVLTRSLSLYSR